MLDLSIALQLVIGLGLLNVWLLRSPAATSYRGGDASNLREEFAVYGLPTWAYYATGALKIGSGALLLAGLWWTSLVMPVAAVVVVLMVGALAMHAKVRDPLVKSLPALAMLAMAVTLIGLSGS